MERDLGKKEKTWQGRESPVALAVPLGVNVTCLFTPGPGVEGSAHTP